MPLRKCFVYNRQGLMFPNNSTCVLSYEVKHMKIPENPDMSVFRVEASARPAGTENTLRDMNGES